MKPASAKAKGRTLQKLVVSAILDLHPELTKNDVRSTGMGQTGRDVQLSEAALKLFPFAVECKNRASMAVYKDYAQSSDNAGSDTPLLVIKQNQSQPLVILSLVDFMKLLRVYKENNTA